MKKHSPQGTTLRHTQSLSYTHSFLALLTVKEIYRNPLYNILSCAVFHTRPLLSVSLALCNSPLRIVYPCVLISHAIWRCLTWLYRYIGEPEKKELLLQLLLWMTGHGYVVGSSSRNLLLKNSHLFGRNRISEILSRQHKMSKVSRTQVENEK
ncbi:hypothetical protein GIB67_036076 [Kingdonia uniflora]|uniref:Uncharacterized protein n=1 Tax=Kingdonia uniflora TaxID=39325 RepID=A0A7J7N901_9MAGN|nr:hypothetical protein GIB67_036076 [Kingdonia uniflora]